jgi:hypothetical protein
MVFPGARQIICPANHAAFRNSRAPRQWLAFSSAAP